MTNEPEGADIMNALMTNGSCQLPLPGIPYGFIVVPLEMDAAWVSERMVAMMWAFWDADAGFRAQSSTEADTPPLPQEPDRPQTRPQAAQPPRGADGQRGTPSQQRPAGGPQKRGSGLWCPDHDGVELVESKAEYQTYDDVDGQQVPAKFFCPGESNGTGSNHSVWRSKARMGARAS